MQNYFFELGQEGRAALDAAGIPFAPVDLGFGDGIIVDDENISRVLEILEGEVRENVDTPVEGLKKLILKFRGGDNLRQFVTVESWDGEGRAHFVEIARDFAKKINQHVILHVPHGVSHQAIHDNNFHIFVNSAPEETAKTSAPMTIWEQEICHCISRGSFTPSNNGEILQDTSGYPVGEVIGRDNLYVFCDLVHHDREASYKIFKRLLKMTAELISQPINPKEEKAREERKLQQETQRRQNTRQQYIRQCAGRLNREIEQVKSAAAEAKERVEKCQRELVEQIRRAQENERRLNLLTTHGNDNESEFGIEFDKLLEVPKVIDVQIQGNKVSVFTDTIIVTDPRSKRNHEIGKFRIELQLTGEGGIVRMFNLTRQVVAFQERKMHHPHVFPDGKPCLGNMAEILPELIANFEFAAAAMVAINYLESVNVDRDDAGRFVDRWPFAK